MKTFSSNIEASLYTLKEKPVLFTWGVSDYKEDFRQEIVYPIAELMLSQNIRKVEVRFGF